MKPRVNVNPATPAVRLLNATRADTRGNCVLSKAFDDEGNNAERRVHERLVAAIVM